MKVTFSNGDIISFRTSITQQSMTVFDLTPGEHAIVTSVSGHGATRQRLLDMGIVPQAEIKVARVAPGGGPIWLALSDSQFALRTQEAKTVHVEKTQ